MLFTQETFVVFADEVAEDFAKATDAVQEETENTTASSGTFGKNDGFSYTFDETTGVLTITGEETLKIYNDEYVGMPNVNATKVIFKDCVFIGKMNYLLDNYASDLVEVVFINCDTTQVTSMRSMFEGCWDLTSLDLSGFDTSSVP